MKHRGSALSVSVCLLGTLAIAGGAAAQERLSVRDAMAFSFASGLVAAPGGDRVAWIENFEGARNIWVAHGPDWSARRLTDYSDDDGQELTSLTFTPDGSRLLFVRGGAPNRQGEVPDPLFTVDAEGRAIWIMDVDGGPAEKVLDAGGFALSPSGDRIAFSRGRDILTQALGSDAEPEPQARVRGGTRSLTWSPDGATLAFTSNRGDHAFVGILDLTDRVVRYVAPSVANDSDPIFSPDGREVAFLRVPNERVVHMFAPKREARPSR